jgi:putative chitinase
MSLDHITKKNFIKNILSETSTNIGGGFKTDLENGPKNHASRALGNWQSDNAWDIFAPPGTVVNSYTNGKVKKVRDTGKNSGKIYGTQVTVTGDGDFPDIFYTHLKNVNLKVGDVVKVGDRIGEVSEWLSNPTITHVHIGLPFGNNIKTLLKNSDVIFGGKGSVDTKLDQLKNTKSKPSSSVGLSQSFYTGNAASNIKMLIGKLKDRGITNPIVQAAILSTIGKESGFVPQNEIGYCGTPDSRVIKIFSDRGRKCKNLKCDNEKFFDCVYGKDSGATLGNTQPGDGYKYRGRGFNQITGRSNYRKYGYESNPDQLNDTEGAAEAAIDFLASEGSSLNNKFKNVDDAVVYFVTKNAGGRRSSMGERKEKEVLAKFNIGSGSDESVSYDDYASTSDGKTSGESKPSGEDKSKLNVLDLMGLGGLNSMISLAKGDEEGFKKNIEKQESLQEQTDRIKDIIKKIL